MNSKVELDFRAFGSDALARMEYDAKLDPSLCATDPRVAHCHYIDVQLRGPTTNTQDPKARQGAQFAPVRQQSQKRRLRGHRRQVNVYRRRSRSRLRVRQQRRHDVPGIKSFGCFVVGDQNLAPVLPTWTLETTFSNAPTQSSIAQ